MDNTKHKPRLVVSTGAGVSAESGLATFRDSGGLWDQYDVMEVASHEGYLRNPELIHKFYNNMRHNIAHTRPNAAHRALYDLEKDFDVRIITQNVDDLHERAGSTNVLHLHGEINAVHAVDDESKVTYLGADDETTPETIIDGHRVRPHIVFFGEAVPNFDPATRLVADADIFVIIGTTLSVYPAASLLAYVRHGVPVYYIDPHPADNVPANVNIIPLPASEGVAKLARILRGEE